MRSELYAAGVFFAIGILMIIKGLLYRVATRRKE